MQSTSNLNNQSVGNPNDPDDLAGFDEEYENPAVVFEQRIAQELAQSQAEIEKHTKNDRDLTRKDTIQVCVEILKRVQAAATELNEQPEQTREKLYYLTFNSTVLIFRLCSTMRKAGYAKEATTFLAFNILCLDNSLILTTVKYLDWRVLNYVELGRAYADLTAFKAAVKVIGYGITKVLYAKKIEEQDPPVPEGSKETLVEGLRVLRTQELKYQLQAGALNAETWRKKLEEVFSVNKYHRSLAIVECLSLNDVNNCHLVQRNAKHLGVKTQCLKVAIELIKADILLVKNALIQIHEKKKRDKEKKEKLVNREEDMDLDELLDKYKSLDNEMIKEKDWKFAGYNVPIEVHVELLKLCFEAQMWTEFDLLLDPALVRLKFRRYEVPFLATVDIQMSATKISNVPNGFEKLPKDLNAANLRIELKKLRASAQKDLGGDETPEKPSDKSKKAEAPKKEEPPAKGKTPAKNDPKGKGKGGKDAPAAKQEEKKQQQNDSEENDVNATDRELKLIQHIYVNMLLQRTKNPQNAIVGLDVVLADEAIGPDLPENHFAVAVPVRQHPGSYEKSKLIPYIVFRRTANSLIDEEDSLSIVTDVQILMGQDRHLRPPLGYTKIPLDLRQTPADLERVPNLDYVFICYKTDKQLSVVERDLLVFRRIAELERTFVAKNSPEFKALTEEDRFLSVTYHLEHLNELSRTLREALFGPLGDYYLETRRDVLNDVCCHLYAKYLLPVLQRIDVYVEMRNQKEFFGDLVDTLDEHVIKIKNQFVEALNVLHRVLTRDSFVDNIIMYSKFSIYYSNLLEETGDFRNSVQSLRAAIGKVVEYREERMKTTICSEDSVTTSMGITIDNKKIGDLEAKIAKITDTWKALILRKERDRVRREAEEEPLDEDEGDEEQGEMTECAEELKEKDLFETDINSEEWHKTNKEKNKLVSKAYFSEQDQIVHALHTDLLVCLYRCEVKLGKEMTVIKSQTNKMLTTQGIDLSKHAPGNMTKNLSTSLTNKLHMAKTSNTLAGSKNALKDLQHTLQEAGKLPPSKPQVLSYEKILERENNQNPYQNALLYMSLAVAKSNSVAQKSLLLESIEHLKKARTAEESMSALALENAVQISASRKFHAYFGKSPDQVPPFSLLSKQIYIKKAPVPAKPIMIARTSTSITMKLPFYKPITEYKSWRNIAEVALYGKPSGSGVAVSLNNTDYPGTGEKQSPGHIVHVTGLIPNERYVFAAGGYTPDGICVNGIGETCKDILTLLPLSLHQLNGYLAEIAFKLGHYMIAKQAAESVCSAFITKNEYKYQFLDARVNPVLSVRLNTDYLRLVSPIEAKQVAESFIILAKVSKIVKNDVQKRSETRELKVENQKMDLKIANYLVIALDIATLLTRPVLIKKVVCELFNHLITYFQMQLQSPLLLQILIKCHQALRIVPAELQDAVCRKIIACLSFQIMKLGFQTSEEPMLRRVMLSELPINARKWRKYSQFVIQKPTLTEEDKLQKDEQKRRIELGEEIPEAELIKEPEPFEEKHFKIEEFEAEGASLDEFLLSLGDYTDVVKAKTEKWKLLVNAFQKQITNGDQVVEQEKEKLTQLVDFWDGIKNNNPVAQLTTVLQTSETSSNKKLLEFCCKCIRRALELPEANFDEISDLMSSKVKVSEEVLEKIDSLLAARIENLDSDVVVKQRARFELLEEKVKQMLEQKALSGGNNQITTKQLKSIMETTNKGLSRDNSQNASNAILISFKNDEDQKAQSYDLLWASEYFYLRGFVQFQQLAYSQSQRSLLSLQNPLNCIFNDIIRLDFNKFKSVLSEHKDGIKHHHQTWQDAHKDDNQQYQIPEPEARVKSMSQFLEVMSKAAQFALNSHSWLQLVSILYYSWNAFSYDLTNPLELTLTSAWKSVVLLAECSLYLLEYLQNGGQLRKIAGIDIDQVKHQKPQFDKDAAGKSVAFKFDTGSELDGEQFVGRQTPVGTQNQTAAVEEKVVQSTSSKGVRWFDQVDEFDVYTHASFIGFAIQCLMSVSKWESMVDMSNRLNSATENMFASQLLPFIIFAQSTLFGDASKKTLSKKRDLNSRVQQFENWKLTNKKKRSRQAMITGEIPPEEQEFLNDKGQLEKEIFRLDVIENVLLSDKEASNKLLENIKRDANNCEESLKACRKLYFQFGVETQNLKSEEIKKGQYGVENTKNHEIRSIRKSHKVFTNMVISSYKKCVDLLRKRQENYLLIQALHELGNLHYADRNLGEAEIQWNDCIDTIFQKLYVVNSFRQVFKENTSLADSFGSRQVLIGGIVLTKLAKLCYEGKDLQKYTECTLMASELFATPAKLTLPHPQTAIEFQSYSFREFMTGLNSGEVPLFFDKQILQPSELLHTLYVVAQSLIDMELFHQALPLCALMEYIAQHVTKSSVIVTKARIAKALALLELGYIDEAYQVYRRVLELRDLPKHGNRSSESASRADGANFAFDSDSGYYNNLSPEDEMNQAAVLSLEKVIEPATLEKLKQFCSPAVLEMLQYLRSMLLIRIGETENTENLDKQALRNNLLQHAEESLRVILKKLQIAEEVVQQKKIINFAKEKTVNNSEVEIENLEIKLKEYYEKAEVSEEDQKTLYSNTEEEMCTADVNSQNLSLMLRVRYALGRQYKKQGQLLNQFYVLRQSLTNFKVFAEGTVYGVETGKESDDKGSFKLPDMYGGGAQASAPTTGGAAGKKGGAAAGKAAAKPAAKAKDTHADKDEQLQKEEAEEKKKKEFEEREALRLVVEGEPRRKHPHMLLWLKTKVEIVNILFAQKRFEDCADTIAVTKLECMGIKDQLFIRQLNQVDFMISVYYGEVQQALFRGHDIRTHAKKYCQTDLSYGEFLGNFSELMYNIDKREEACEVVKEGRLIAWYCLRDRGIEIEQQNINSATDVLIDSERKKPNADVLSAHQSAPVPQGKAAGKQAKEVKGKAGAHAAATQEELPTEKVDEIAPLDFSKKVEYKLVPATEEFNSSKVAQNIYLQGLTLAIRFDLRYAQYCTTIQQKYDLAKKVLTDTSKLILRTMYVSPQLKFYCSYLLGLANQRIFVEKVLQFQGNYESLRKYKKSLTDHIPHDSFALGNWLLDLPNFSKELKEKLTGLLDEAKVQFESAINVGKGECVLYEFDFSLKDALQGLAETHFYLGEYRSRSLEYKYAKYDQLDKERKLLRQKERKDQAANDNIDENELVKEDIDQKVDKWEEEKDNREIVAIYNHQKASVHYLEASVAIAEAQREFMDRQHILGATNLMEPAKIPREIASEMFEASQVSKVVHSKLQGFEFKDKTAITSSEMLAYLKALLIENQFFTFGPEKERLGKLISKVHRYLKTYLSSYTQKCSGEVKQYADEKDPIAISKTTVLQKAQIRSQWTDFSSQNSNMFYILGALDDDVVAKKEEPVADDAKSEADKSGSASNRVNEVEETKEMRAEIRAENLKIYFGKVEADPVQLSTLHQDVRDLVNKMTASEKLSEAQNTRDREAYQTTFEQLIDRLGGFFKPPILSEEEIDKEVDCLKLVKDLIPPLSTENVAKLATLLSKESGWVTEDNHYNAILRKFHLIRYAK